jgi:hypothetical protein
MMLLVASLLALVAAQLNSDQYAAVRMLLTGLGCLPPNCTAFAANETCPSVLSCVGGVVDKLNLTNELTLTGSINGTALGALTNLTFMNLNGHNLTTIPTQIGRLTALTHLNLGGSMLTGSVPSEVNNMTKLQTLIFHANLLTGTLPPLTKLTNLTFLDVRNNTGLGGDLPEMPIKLTALDVSNCSFTALPLNVLSLKSLNELYASKNRFRGPPPSFSNTRFGTDPLTCFLQRNVTDETNCFDCPAAGMIDKCRCHRIPRCTTNATAVSTPATATTMATTTGAPLDPTAGSSLPGDVPEGVSEWLIAVIACVSALVVIGIAISVTVCVVRGKRASAGLHRARTDSNEMASARDANEYGKLTPSTLPSASVYSQLSLQPLGLDEPAPVFRKTYDEVPSNKYDVVAPVAVYDAPPIVGDQGGGGVN